MDYARGRCWRHIQSLLSSGEGETDSDANALLSSLSSYAHYVLLQSEGSWLPRRPWLLTQQLSVLLASETKAFDAKERFELCGAIACLALELESLRPMQLQSDTLLQQHKVARVESFVMRALHKAFTVPNGANLIMVESVLPRLHQMVEFLSASHLQACAEMLLGVHDDLNVVSAAQQVHVSMDLHGRSVGINALGFGQQFYAHSYLGKCSIDDMQHDGDETQALGMKVQVPPFFSAAVHVSYSWGVTRPNTQLFPQRFAYNSDLMAATEQNEAFVRRCHFSLLCASIVDSLQPADLLRDAIQTRVQLAIKLGQNESAGALAFVGALGSHSGRLSYILMRLATNMRTQDIMFCEYSLWGCVRARSFYTDKVKPRLRELGRDGVAQLCLQILLQAAIALGVVEYHCRMRALSYEKVKALVRDYQDEYVTDKLTFAVCAGRTPNFVGRLLRTPTDESVLSKPLRNNPAAENVLRNAGAFAVPFWENENMYTVLQTTVPNAAALWQNMSACLLQSLCTYDVCVANICRTVDVPAHTEDFASTADDASTPRRRAQRNEEFYTPVAQSENLFCSGFVAQIQSEKDIGAANQAFKDLVKRFSLLQQSLPTCGYLINQQEHMSGNDSSVAGSEASSDAVSSQVAVGISSRVEGVLKQFRSYTHGKPRDGPVPVFVAVDLLFHGMVETGYVCPVHVYTTQNLNSTVPKPTILSKLATRQFFALSVQKEQDKTRSETLQDVLLHTYSTRNTFAVLYRDFEEHSDWVHSQGYKHHPKLMQFMANGFWLAVAQFNTVPVNKREQNMDYLLPIFDVLTTSARFGPYITANHSKLADKFVIISEDKDTPVIIPSLNFLQDNAVDILDALQEPEHCNLILWSCFCTTESDSAALQDALVRQHVPPNRADIFVAAMGALSNFVPIAMRAYETVNCQMLFGRFYADEGIYDLTCFDDEGNSLLQQDTGNGLFVSHSARRSLELSLFATRRAARLETIAGLPPEPFTGEHGDVAPDVRYTETKVSNSLVHGTIKFDNNYARNVGSEESHCLFHTDAYVGAWMAFCIPSTLRGAQFQTAYNPTATLSVLQDMYGHASKFRTFVPPADVACHVAMLLQICTGIRLYGLPLRKAEDNARLYTLRQSLDCVMAWCDNVIVDGEPMSFLAHLAQEGIDAPFLRHAHFLRAALAEEFAGCASGRVSVSACVSYSALCAVEVMFGLCATQSGTARSGRLTMPSTYVAQLLVNGQPDPVEATFGKVQKYSTLYPTEDPQVGSILRVLQTLRGTRT